MTKTTTSDRKKGVAASAASSLMIVGLALGASPASAAVITLEPAYASAADAPAGTYAGFNPPADVEVLPPELTTTPLVLSEPAASTGVILDPATVGTVTMTSERIVADPTSQSHIVSSGSGTSYPLSDPENLTLVSDFTLMNYRQGAWRYTFDFTALEGGALPAGSILSTSDIDVCSATRNESVQMSADSAEPWLQFDFNHQIPNYPASQGAPTVSFDDETGIYSVDAGTNPCGNVNMNNWFHTLRPITTLTVVMNNAAPPAGGWVYFGFLVPTMTPEPAVTLVKTTNGQDVAAAPGPEIAAGSPVTWEYTATNTGNVTLGAVTVTDDRVDTSLIDCGDDTNVVDQLAVGASVTCTASSIAQEGPYENTATVTGDAVTSTGEVLAGTEPATATRPR